MNTAPSDDVQTLSGMLVKHKENSLWGTEECSVPDAPQH